MFLPAIVVVSLLGTLFYHISVDYCLHSMVRFSTYFCNHVIYTCVMVSHQRNVCRNCGLCDKSKNFCVYFVPIFNSAPKKRKKKLTFKMIFCLQNILLKKKSFHNL